MRLRKPLSAGAVVLGLLGGTLTTAQASTGTPSKAQALPAAITPQASAAQAEAACDARIKAARDTGEGKLVACVTWGTKSSAARDRAALTKWPTPSWCLDHGADSKWWVTRFKACGVFPADLSVTDTRTGQVVGRMHYLVVGYAYGAYNVWIK